MNFVDCVFKSYIYQIQIMNIFYHDHLVSKILNISYSISCISPQIINECMGSPKSLSRNDSRVPLAIFYVSVPILASPIHGVSLLYTYNASSGYFAATVSSSCCAAQSVFIYLYVLICHMLQIRLWHNQQQRQVGCGMWHVTSQYTYTKTDRRISLLYIISSYTSL